MARGPKASQRERRSSALTLPLRIVRSRPWLFLCAAIGTAVGFVLPFGSGGVTRCLIGWDAGILLYFIIIGWMMAHADVQAIRRKANDLDEGRFVVLLVSIAAAVISFVAIVVELGVDKDLKGTQKALHVTLALSTIVLSWFFVHLTFALHYAHDYFFADDIDNDGDLDLRGGLKFPETDEPTYIDFLYYAFTIGVAAQTADVETTSSKMRLVTLLHSILSYFFNTAIIAMTINIAAALF